MMVRGGLSNGIILSNLPPLSVFSQGGVEGYICRVVGVEYSVWLSVEC